MNGNRRIHHMDFVLNPEGFWNEQLIFRFYPHCSHMHSFGDEPPEHFGQVYKVYYSWAILKRIVGLDEDLLSKTEVVFKMGWDECSALFGLEDVVKYCSDDSQPYYEEYKTMSPGQPGSVWEFQRQKRCVWDGAELSESPENDVVEFSVWNNYTSQGYRFYLRVDKAREFAEYIGKVNQYMLEHGEPI